MVTSCLFRDKVTLIHASRHNVNITEIYSPAFDKEFCSRMLEMLVLAGNAARDVIYLRSIARTLSPTPAWISIESCS